MIQVKSLTFDYSDKRALHDVSFEIAPNTITALVGPNGAGKTTLLRCLAALDTWTSGEIFIDHIEAESHPREIHKTCSYLSDFFGLYDELTVGESLRYLAMSRGAPSSDIKQLALDAAKQLDLLDYYGTKAASLSRGLRQRLAIAQTLVVLPKVLILDEPASGLDPEARFSLSKLLIQLKNKGTTIIVSSHILSELEDYCTHMLMIDEGRIVKQCALDETSNTEYELTLSEDIATHREALISCGLTIISFQDKRAKILIESNLGAPALLKKLIGRDLPVEGLTAIKQSMQDVYLGSKGDKK